jgi:UDP-N-acetylmuramoyl-L-alanyl-D-glutamate--2,6-diaminopimelate ligase
MPNPGLDTHTLLPVAKSAGALGAVVHSETGEATAKSVGMPWIRFSDDLPEFNRSLGDLCTQILGDSTAELHVVGITGTNGKTTTAWLIHEALTALGHKSAYLGTLGLWHGTESVDLANTTPFPVELHHLLLRCRREGITHLAMEVSSHGLQEERIAGVRFDVGVFTNLSQDHLDYHGSMERYFAAKRRLFFEVADRAGKPFKAVINSSDPAGMNLVKDLQAIGRETLTFGPGGMVRLEDANVKADSIQATFCASGGKLPLRAGLGGMFNSENLLAAGSALLAVGKSMEDVVSGLSRAKPVPGRFEPVPNDAGFAILVDYAHTPDALAKLLEAVRALGPKRVITVFGCGGDRDRSKRPKMAAAASERSDLTLVTSDNPRTEDPEAILSEVVAGVEPGKTFEAIVDRREAIARAVALAEPGDIVVIAGKGHEDYQIIGKTKFPMDDRELAKAALQARMVTQ